MYIRPKSRHPSAWTLVELVVATGIFSLAGVACASLYMFSIRSYAGMVNYVALDKENRQAMDQLTREIRQAKQVSSVSTSPASVTILNGDGLNVTYTFDPTKQQMIRSASDGTSSTLLKNCSLLAFNLFQRNPSNGTYNIYPAATNNWQQSVKVIQLTWKTIRTLPNGIQSENIQTARVVIRKQQDDN
jgi:type II secretory pathway component PulJ